MIYINNFHDNYCICIMVKINHSDSNSDDYDDGDRGW